MTDITAKPEGGRPMAMSGTLSDIPKGPFDSVIHATSGDEPSPNEMLAQIIWLMTKSSFHRKWYICDLEYLIMPPIHLGQCMIFRQGKTPIGYLSWANLTDDAQNAYVFGTRQLVPGDWAAGQNMWWIDFIAPFGHLKLIGRRVRKQFPDTVAHSIRYSEDLSTRKIYRWDRGRINFVKEVQRDSAS